MTHATRIATLAPVAVMFGACHLDSSPEDLNPDLSTITSAVTIDWRGPHPAGHVTVDVPRGSRQSLGTLPVGTRNPAITMSSTSDFDLQA